MMLIKTPPTLGLVIVITCALILDLCGPASGSSNQNHSCYRKCDGKPRNCRYEFNVEWYFVLSKACFNCANKVPADCFRPHCVQGDGRQRPVIVANRQMPGPSINVCENDVVEVQVTNFLTSSEGVTIHWHGVHQVGTPYMDGVASLTQCTVPTHASFTYRFTASPAGTHFWHAHSGLQRGDGLAGNFVVRQKEDPQAHLYDYDLKEHEVLLFDWTNFTSLDKFLGHHHAGKDNKASNILINGRGQCDNCDQNGVQYLLPLETFNVTRGKRYRFRVASNAYLNCPISVSIENHTLLMIASDGNPIEPFKVSNFIIQSGERYDFVLNANAKDDNYYFMAQGLFDCGENDGAFAKQAAIIHYAGASAYDYQKPLPSWDKMVVQGKRLNPINVFESADQQYITSVKALQGDEKLISASPDHSFYLFYYFRKINNKNFNDAKYYPLSAVDRILHLYTPQLNDISMVFPPSPPLTQFSDLDPNIFCDNNTVVGRNCPTEYCDCVHRLVIKKDAIVDLILVDNGFTFNATHPFHIHGYAFRVMAIKKIGASVTKEEIYQLANEGKLFDQNPKAPLKDTVMVHSGGYTVVRFRANNPGIWFFHCHLEFHVEIGMGLVLQVGEPKDFTPTPSGFPRCGSWKGIYKNDLSVIASGSGVAKISALSLILVFIRLAASSLHLVT